VTGRLNVCKPEGKLKSMECYSHVKVCEVLIDIFSFVVMRDNFLTSGTLHVKQSIMAE
jgi:hypothetical protein